MSWIEILKNIQIGSQKTSSRDYVIEDEPEEDCFAWFTKLYHLVQGEVVEQDMDVEPFREYTNEKLWCPLKNRIKLQKEQQEFTATSGVVSFVFTSEVVLSGERVNFRLSVDVPEANKKLEDLPDTIFYIFFEIMSTSDRIEVVFFQAASNKPDKKSLRWKYTEPPELQMKNYQEISRKVLLYMKEALS